MDKCVIFGAGNIGRSSYYKLSQFFEVLYYVDNNPNIQGSDLNGIRIISMKELESIYNSEIKIVICTMAYREIAGQLKSRGFSNFLIMIEGMLYTFDEMRVLIPYEAVKMEYYHKQCDEKNILFVQDIACIRTHKIAKLMKDKGYKVYLLYTVASATEKCEEQEEKYDAVYTLFTQKAMIDFVKNSDFDIIHSSNAPDYLTALLLNTNKPMVHDCHDMMSLQGYDTCHILTLENMVNIQADGVIYTSEGVRKLAKRMFGREDDNVFVLENYITKQLERKKNYKRLSEFDGEIHCVYEGGIGVSPGSDRYFEEIWSKIADCGIHIHFYSQTSEWYCRKLAEQNEYFHYEGNMGSEDLVNEMTKYDCGLAIFNVNEDNRTFLETGTANKVYEYINAGIPVVVGNINSYIEFVENYKVGMYLDLEGDIKEQLEEVCRIQIKDNFLQENGFTMEAKSAGLASFYAKIIEEYNKKECRME